MSVTEKRRVQRLRLKTPLAATAIIGDLRIVDLSTVGARVEHDFPLTARRNLRLTFHFGGKSYSLSCEVVRCRLQKSCIEGNDAIVYNTGLRFVDPNEPARNDVRELLATLLLRERPHRGVAEQRMVS